MTLRSILFFTGAFIPHFVAWCGGLDYDHRSEALAFTVALSLASGAVGLAISFAIQKVDRP